MADIAEGGFHLASFSSRGPTRDDRMKPEISAPGVNISAPKANSTNQYVSYSGTSMATPYVSGVVALMLDANPNLTVAQVRDILRTTAQDWGPAGQDIDYGWGRLDAHAAVKRAGTYPGGTAPTVPGHVTFSGTLTGPKVEHSFTVGDTTYPVAITLIMPGWSGSGSPDFDLYVFNPDGSELGRATGSTRQETLTKRIAQTGTYRMEFRAYSGTGEYVVDVSAGLGAAPDLPPTVAIEEPLEGAVVSGSTRVLVRAADDAGLARVELAVDDGAYADITGSFDGTHYTYVWETAGAGRGAHRLTARATDTAGQAANATRNLTVDNEAPEPGLVHELQRNGRVTGGTRDASFTINVHEAGYVDLTLTWFSRADLDFYVYAPDGSQIGRAYTLNNPERFRIDTVRYGAGAYRVRVNLFDGPDSDFILSARGFRQETYQSAVTPGARNMTHQRPMAHTGRGRAAVGWTGSSDIDFYLLDPSGRERGRAYTLANPEALDTPIDVTGVWSIRVNLYSGAGGTYTLRWIVPEAVLS